MTFHPDQPFDLPLLPPPLTKKELFRPDIAQLTVKANRAVSELNGLCRALPHPYPVLMNIPVLQEAVSSSAIEGIHTTVETLVEAQIKMKSEQDPASKEAFRYREALHSGFQAFQKYESLATRVILNIHKQLLPSGGRFKEQANKIARGPETLYTPPIPAQVSKLMSDWEKYIHFSEDLTDPLIKIIVSHYQFEAIHPFSDGNGRTGRILIVLQTVLYKLLDFPVLYISGYLIKHRTKYYSLLLQITKSGDWTAFIRFFLSAFAEQAQVTKNVILNILKERKKMKQALKSRRRTADNHDFLDHIFCYPVTHATFMAKQLNLSYQTAGKHLSDLEKTGLLRMKKSGKYKLYYNFGLLDCLKT